MNLNTLINYLMFNQPCIPGIFVSSDFIFKNENFIFFHLLYLISFPCPTAFISTRYTLANDSGVNKYFCLNLLTSGLRSISIY